MIDVPFGFSRHSQESLQEGLLAAITLAVIFVASCGEPKKTPIGPGIEKQSIIDYTPAWSPDGLRIIYFRTWSEQGLDKWPWGVYVHFVETEADSLLWPNFEAYDFSWSPDGKQVAYSRGAQIFVRDLESGSERQVTFEGRNFGCRWSPCGDMLMFFDRLVGRGLYTFDLRLDSLDHVSQKGESVAGEWAPGCSTAILIDYADYIEADIVLYSLTDGTSALLVRSPGYKRAVDVSPSGRMVLYTVKSDIWAFEMTERATSRLTNNGGEYPSWSPDGQWIVYTKVDSLNGYLWLMRPDGSEKHQITF